MLIHEVAKFGIVGSLAFVLTIVLFNVFHSGAGMGPILATTLANVLATVFAFVGNKFWAFRHRKGSHWGRETAAVLRVQRHRDPHHRRGRGAWCTTGSG